MSLPDLQLGALAPTQLGDLPGSTPGESLPQAMDLTPKAMDERVRSIRSIDSSWPWPELPDQVRLDLAMSPDFAQRQDVVEFLNGISADLEKASRPEPRRPSPTTVPTPRPGEQIKVRQPETVPNVLHLPEDDYRNEIRRLFHGVAGFRAPEIISNTAVQDLKARAIEAGLLDPSTPIDGSWSADLRHIRLMLRDHDFRQRSMGGKPGSTTTDRVMEMMDDWLSPSGLLSTAVSLNFLPDVGKVANEFSTWGEKLGNFLKNPTSPRNLLELLGPIDDIVLPVFNSAMLFTGVGSVVQFARGASMAARGVRAGSLGGFGGRLGQRLVPGANRLENVIGEVDRWKQAGIISTRLQRSRFNPLVDTGSAMERWRSQTSVLIAKKAVQQGMKMGFIGNVENLLLPDTEGIGITGSGSQLVRVEDFKAWRTSNSLTGAIALGLAEAAFTPVNMFQRGLVTGSIRKARELTFDRFFTEVTREQQLGVEFLTGYRGVLDARRAAAEAIGNVDEAQRYRSMLSEFDQAAASNPTEALTRFLGNGDQVVAGEKMTYLTISAALQKAAWTEAVAAGKAEGTTDFLGIFHTKRNALINQLRDMRHLDLDSPEGIREYARIRAGLDAGDLPMADGGVTAQKAMATRRKVWSQIVDEMESADEAVRTAAFERARAEIRHHNELRTAAFHDLLDVLEPGDLPSYMNDVFDTLDNWDDFKAGLGLVDEWRAAGYLDGINVAVPWRADDMSSWLPSQVAEDMSAEALKWGKRVRGSFFNGLLKKDLSRGRFTVAKLDTPTAQQAASLERLVRQLRWAERRLTGAPADLASSLRAFAAERGKDISKLTTREIRIWRQGLDEGLRKGSGEWAQAYRWVGRHIGDLDDPLRSVQSRLDSLNANTELWSKLRVSGAHVTLDDKIAELARQRKFLATEVALPPELATELKAKGYKLVHGVDFLQPADVLDFAGPLAEIKNSHLRKVSLGRFIDRHSAETIGQMRRNRFRQMIGPALQDLADQGKLTSTVDGQAFRGKFTPAADDPNVNTILAMLRDKHEDVIRSANELYDNARSHGWLSGMTARFTNSMISPSIFDLPEKHVIDAIGPLIGEEGAKRVVGVLRNAKRVGWEYEGLQGIESYLVANSIPRAALGLFSKTSAADDIGALERFRRGLAGGTNAGDFDSWQRIKNAVRAARRPGFNANRNVGKPLAGAAAGAAVGYINTGELEGTAVGAAAGAAVAPAVTAKSLAHAGMFGLGYGAAGGFDEFSVEALLAGGGAVGAARFGAPRALRGIESAGWREYSRLSYKIQELRNRIRFSLNPFFDAQRYTEAWTLAATGQFGRNAQGKPYTLPLNPSVSKFRKMPKNNPSRWWKVDVVDEFQAAARGWFDFEAVEASQAFFRERGILNFSPIDFQAAAWGHLVDQGMDAMQAVEQVRELYTYGVKGRSALELSINFIFFPFSFQKKIYTHVARFLADDLGRTVLVHDALKTYEILHERYDLSERYREYMPLLNQLRKFNTLAYGINPGELGGINRPVIDGLMMAAEGIGEAVVGQDPVDPILNLFIPQGMMITNETDARDLQYVFTRLAPVYRDLQQLASNTVDQIEVLRSPTHQTRQGQIRSAYEEWNDFKRTLESMARDRGLSYDSLIRSERGEPIRQLVDQKRRELQAKYPAWAAARAEHTGNVILMQQEIKDIIAEPANDAERAMARFHIAFEAGQEIAKSMGFDLMDDPELVPEYLQDLLRRQAIQIAQEAPGFDHLYRVYYQRHLGPIHQELI